jgi:hypothetical protein
MEETTILWEEAHRVNGSYIYVTRKACKDCPLFCRDHPQVTEEFERRKNEEGWVIDHFFECVCVTLGEQQGRIIPELSVCFSFFYLYAQENIYLAEAIRDGRIRYLDVSDWPTPTEMGRLFCKPYIIEEQIPRRTFHTPYLPETGENE